MGDFRIVFPHRSVIGAPVSGTVDADYLNTWLTDGLPGYPARRTGNLSLTVAPSPAISIDLVAVCHHAIRQAATITLGGDLSGTITTAAWLPDDIPRNWYKRFTNPVTSVDSFTIAVTGNTDPVVIGELYAGLSWTPVDGVRHGRALSIDQPFAWEGEFSSLAPYWNGVRKPRRYRCELLLEDAEFEELEAGALAQRSGNRPCLVVMDDAKNDAMLAIVHYDETTTGFDHLITLEIVEIPPLDW